MDVLDELLVQQRIEPRIAMTIRGHFNMRRLRPG
jgi:hypothetical protein